MRWRASLGSARATHGGRTVALVVAAGSGSRAGGEVPKQYRRVAGKAAARPCRRPSAPSRHRRRPGGDRRGPGGGLSRGDRRRAPSPPRSLGGATRRQSVRERARRRWRDAERVLIHDAARPFLPGRGDRPAARRARQRMTARSRLCRWSTRWRGATASAGRRATALVRVQTPQAFRFEAIRARPRRLDRRRGDRRRAGRARGGARRRDRRRRSGAREADLRGGFRARPRRAAAGARAPASASTSTRFAAGEALWLGGVRIPHDKGLKGHSDADVALHALTDAILGALAAGDIGDHFPPSDPQWRGARLVALPRTCPRPGRAGGRADRPCRRDDHLRGAADRPASGRDARADRRRCCGCRRRGLASRRRPPSGSASPAAAKASRPRRWRRVRLPEDR